MKASIAIVTTVVLGAGLGLVAVSAQGSEELAKKSGCMTCHDVAAKKVGPAFKDIAAKNKGKEDAVVAKLAKHHGGEKASADDRKALAKWVLSQ
ncbi:c-type cytochrome [Usitatibacter palustris]|uniref:Cytochrome c-552 n=1 Tax=Usitatibacter palustris TaxID=2732487 RepID=A0A6M4H9R4_9PROT|nr:c-type cytochrome [Usitatibacter palustris]QJR15608.1 Cytochrome c-552 [Usitatibacter palustris]